MELFDMVDILDEVPTIPINNFSCRFCPFSASSKVAIGRHETLHFTKDPYKCLHCPRVFKERHHLQSHLHSHDSTAHFSCPFCWKSFRHSSSLARHKKSHRLQNNTL